MTTTTVRRDTRRVPSVPSVRLRPGGPLPIGRPVVWPILLLAALIVAVVVGFEVSGGTSTYPLTAVFAKTPGLFSGAAVNVLGVRVGTVTAVRNVGDTVVVDMALKRTQSIPTDVVASFESPALLGQPDIDLSPGYAGGPRLGAGAVIPETRTTEPVSTDRVLKDLATTLNQLNPHAVSSLVTNLAQDLNGEGAALHQLITGAAGTLQLLAAKGNDLGQLNGSLAQLTGALDSRTSEIQNLITAYDTVSGVVAGHSTQLSGAITQLTNATTDLVNLLTPNLSSLEQDIGTITTAGRTIDRNIPSIDLGLAQSVRLFTAAGRAYDPTYNWLNLNNQLPLGVTGDYVAGLIRDRLAGICRRILANHSAGLSSQEIATLASCGNPSSGFFDPILNTVSGVLNTVGSGSPSPTTPLSMLQQGLSQIPGVGAANGGSTSGASGAGSSRSSGSGSGSSSGSGSGGGSSGSGSSGSGSGSSGSGTGSSGSGSSGSGGGSSGSSGSGGGSCLLPLICGVSSTAPSPGAPNAQVATYSPSLTAPAAHLLPPMPRAVTHPGRHHRPHKHRGPVLATGHLRSGGGSS